MKIHLILICLCVMCSACGGGGGDTAPPLEESNPSFIADDLSDDIAAVLVSSPDLQWYCNSVTQDADWSVQIAFLDNRMANYTFASGEVLEMSWLVDLEPRIVEWDDDFDGVVDRTEQLNPPVLSLASDSFHNIRETFVEVAIEGQQLVMVRIKERNAALQRTEIVCDQLI